MAECPHCDGTGWVRVTTPKSPPDSGGDSRGGYEAVKPCVCRTKSRSLAGARDDKRGAQDDKLGGFVRADEIAARRPEIRALDRRPATTPALAFGRGGSPC